MRFYDVRMRFCGKFYNDLMNMTFHLDFVL